MADNEAIIAALRRERAGYERRGMKDRVAEVDAELKRLGGSKPAATSEEQADSTPRETAVESKPRRTASGRGAKAAE